MRYERKRDIFGADWIVGFPSTSYSQLKTLLPVAASLMLERVLADEVVLFREARRQQAAQEAAIVGFQQTLVG